MYQQDLLGRRDQLANLLLFEDVGQVIEIAYFALVDGVARVFVVVNEAFDDVVEKGSRDAFALDFAVL